MTTARGRMRSKIFLVVCALAACKTKPTPVAGTEAGVSGTTAGTNAGLALTATAVAPSSATAEPKAPSKPALVDLLHTVASTVVVSSKVQNPRDYPEHLVDGKLDTAWNGKTGNLVGGFIAFEVPKETRVRGIELTPGFAHVGKPGDLFTMNHRIARVRVTREGQAIGDFDLDPNKRELQGLAVDAAGGNFRIEVLSVVPGTKKAWKELVVSELRVWGERNDAPENTTHLPLVYVGSVGGPPPPTKGVDGAPVGPFASLEEMCAKYKAALKDPIKKYWGSGDRYPGEITSHCAVWSVSSAPLVGLDPTSIPKDAPFLDVQFYNAHSVHEDFVALAVKTPKGWFRTDARTTQRDHTDPGCLRAYFSVFRSATINPAADGSSVLMLQFVEHEASWGGPDTLGSVTDIEKVISCRSTREGALTCDRGEVMGRRAQPLPPGFDPGSVATWRFNPQTPAWQLRKKPMLTPTGEVRLVEELR